MNPDNLLDPDEMLDGMTEIHFGFFWASREGTQDDAWIVRCDDPTIWKFAIFVKRGLSKMEAIALCHQLYKEWVRRNRPIAETTLAEMCILLAKQDVKRPGWTHEPEQ